VTTPSTLARSAFRATSPSSRVVFVALGLLALLVTLARLRTRDEPFERDITTYAVIGHELLAGRSLYADLWDIKPPGVYVTYAAAEVVAGYGPNAILLLGVATTMFTLASVFAGVSAERRPAAGLWAAAAFAIVSGNITLQANQPNTEVFINACLALLLALLLRARGSLGFRRAAAAGALLFVGTIFKPYVAVAGLVLLVHVAAPPSNTLRKSALRETAIAGIVLLAGWLGIVIYFQVTSRWVDLHEVLVVYGRHYAGDPAGNIARSFLTGWTSMLPLGAVLAAAGAGLLLRRPKRARPWLLLLAWAFAVHIMVALPGKGFPHYLQLWLPVLAVAFGQLIGDIAAAFDDRRAGSHLGSALAAFVVVGLFAAHLPASALSPDEVSRAKYGETFIRVRALGADLSTLLGDAEGFFHFGVDSGLYFHAHRSPPIGPLIARHYVAGPLAQKLQLRIVRDLERKPPELVVLSRDFLEMARKSHSPQPVLDWIEARYRWLEISAQESRLFPRLLVSLRDSPSPYLFLVRSGGAVEARVRSQAFPPAGS
jgi:hypothetical protein